MLGFWGRKTKNAAPPRNLNNKKPPILFPDRSAAYLPYRLYAETNLSGPLKSSGIMTGAT